MQTIRDVAVGLTDAFLAITAARPAPAATVDATSRAIGRRPGSSRERWAAGAFRAFWVRYYREAVIELGDRACSTWSRGGPFRTTRPRIAVLGHDNAVRGPVLLADPRIATPDSRDVLDAVTEIDVVDVAASIVARLAKRQPRAVDLEHQGSAPAARVRGFSSEASATVGSIARPQRRLARPPREGRT
jgi:hypothetical protein